MTVSELSDRIGSSELTEWMGHGIDEPFGGPIDDYRAALAAAMFLNANRAEGAQPVTPYDLIPWIKKPDEVMVIDDECDEKLARIFNV